jgi:hypothetical protein
VGRWRSGRGRVLVGSASVRSNNRRVSGRSTRPVPWRGCAGGSASAEWSHLVGQYLPRWAAGQRVGERRIGDAPRSTARSWTSAAVGGAPMLRRPADLGCSAFAVDPGQLLAELVVLLAQPADLVTCELESAAQGGVRGALARRDRRRARRCPCCCWARSRPISRRRSGWAYSQERDTSAVRATVSKGDRVAGGGQAPQRSNGSLAGGLAAPAGGDAQMVGVVSPHLPRPWLAGVGVVVGFQRGDDAVEVPKDLLVHLGQADLPVGGGRGEQLSGLLAVLAVLIEELRGGDEHRAGQPGIGVRGRSAGPAGRSSRWAVPGWPARRGAWSTTPLPAGCRAGW